MIKEAKIRVTGHPRNLRHYLALGYDAAVRKSFEVDPKHLMPGTTARVTTVCQACGRETSNTFKDYFISTDSMTTPFFCKGCNQVKNRRTSMARWGVDNPMKSDQVKDRVKSTVRERYGVDHYSKTEDYKKKYRLTCLDRYGVENSFQSEEVKSKSKTTSRNKWGKDYYLQTQEMRSDSKAKKESRTLQRFRQAIGVEYEILAYMDAFFTVRHVRCGRVFQVPGRLMYSRMKGGFVVCTECNPVEGVESGLEAEVGHFLEDCGVDFVRKDRSVLGDRELDFLLPGQGIAIEVNGLYWHGERYRGREYHADKTRKCREAGIDLVHVWEDDWLHRKDIVKSILRYRLGISTGRIYARACELREVVSSEARLFLEGNHIQGHASSQHRLGLYHRGELVSLMTFGWRYTNSKREMELIRFCNRSGLSVVGAASRLFKRFLGFGEIEKVISYSDESMFGGGMYESLGFVNKGVSRPNYFWVVGGKRRHRFNYCKSKLVSQGSDPMKSEVQIMHERGYRRVWGCGQTRWEFASKASPAK